MSAPHGTRRDRRFFLAFGLVALLLAGLASYLAYPEPDGLDTATLEGCEVVETDGGEELTGSCVAQNAEDSAVADGPFADYTVGGDEGLLGLSGVVGVLVTLLVAGGLFRLLRPRRSAGDRAGPDRS